ncbi:MAG: glycoside hydrolase family 55 protein [Acidobacteriia bacterium]|nr:glycoside hydrolase family 55 protein [Terriglobia bacterium]
MKRAFFVLLCTAGAWSQNTAKFPTRLPVNADFGIATNRAQTTLTSGIGSSDTSIPVASSGQFKAGSFATIDGEILAVCAIPDGTHLTAGVTACPNADGRGIDTSNGGGAAASHLVNAVVQGRITAWPMNQAAAEIISLAKSQFGVSLNVKNYGAVGDGSTDDTTAISNAITASLSGTYPSPPCVLFPAGTYKVTSTIQISSRSVCIRGVTPWSTFINSTISAPIFNLDTYSSTQDPPWTGVANNFTLRDITLENSSQTNVSNTGSRVTTGVQSNGSGHITVENVQFTGLKYGFVAPYGSDFDRFRNVWNTANDVGIYLGPSNEQFSLFAIEGDRNGETVVCDGCGQGAISDSTFEDSKTADITFEREQPTRFGWNPAGISSYDVDSSVTISHNWFETGAGFGGLTAWQEYRRILFQSSGGGLASYPRNVVIRNSFLVLGNGGIAAKDGSVHSFVELASGKFIQVSETQVVGDRRDCEIYGNGGQAVEVNNILIDDGYSTSIPIFLFASGDYQSNNYSYNKPFQNTGATGSIPSTCYSGTQFWYDTTLSNWLACIGTGGAGGLGTFSYLAQLDNTFHLPNALNTLAPSWNSWTVNGSTTVNAILTAVYAGNSGANNGYWWVQNGGSPVHPHLAGYDATGTLRVNLDPGGSLGTVIGGISTGVYISTGTTFANLSAPAGGSMVWCSDCNIVTPCTGGGAGAWAFRGQAGWACPF